MKTDKKSLAFIKENVKKYYPAIALISLMNIAVSVMLILLARYSRDIINSSINLKEKATAIGIIILIQITVSILSSFISAAVSGKITILLRKKIFNELSGKKFSEISDIHSGNILNSMTSDVASVVSGSVTIIPQLCSMLSKITVGLIALFTENWILALVVVFAGAILPLIGRLLSPFYKKLHKLVQSSEGKTRSFLQECLANITVIKTFAGNDSVNDKLNEYMSINYGYKIRQNVFSTVISTSLYTVFTVGYYAVVVWGAATGLSFGNLYYFLQLISILRAPLQNISGLLPRFYGMTASAERITELLDKTDEPPLIDDRSLNNLKKSFKCISVKNLSFSYGNEPVLENCTFDIKRNGITVITGESGSGKSTFFKLILGLYDATAGSITFDGKTNINSSTRKMFSYVPQGNMILSGSIKDNITLFNSEIPDEKIANAAKAAEIYDYIVSLPDGFNTVLSERGSGLSEGQIQRLAIARSLLFDAPIILLDEATSSLDETTETNLLNNIKNMTDKTVIFITHRNKPTDACDYILNLKDNKFEYIK